MGRSKGKSDFRNRRALRIAKQPILSVNDNTSETLLIGTISDLLEEVKNLLLILHKSKTSKEESSHVFQSLLGEYQPLIGINYRDIITLFIYEACKNHYHIQLPLEEIKSWWPDKEDGIQQ